MPSCHSMRDMDCKLDLGRVELEFGWPISKISRSTISKIFSIIVLKFDLFQAVMILLETSPQFTMANSLCETDNSSHVENSHAV